MKDANLDINFNGNGGVDANLNSDQQLNVNIGDIKMLNASFNAPQSLNIQLATDQILNADFGISTGHGECKVLYNTTKFWNDRPQLKSKEGYLYIYSDWKQNGMGQNIAGIKVGDGNAYLIDIPFNDELLYTHIDDNIRHITQAERDFWNNKVRCYILDKTLVFTTN